MKTKESFKKQFIFQDNKILVLEEVNLGYNFKLYSQNKKILYSGILETKNSLSLEEILKEIFGYLDIAEKEIKTLKPYNKETLSTKKVKIVENKIKNYNI